MCVFVCLCVCVCVCVCLFVCDIVRKRRQVNVLHNLKETSTLMSVANADFVAILDQLELSF
jgi:hypothetical protein